MRSLWHLSRHLTARADDNHAAPRDRPSLEARIIELNHMFLRLCGPPSIPLSFTVAGVLPRWITQRFRWGTHCLSRTPGDHRLRRGLPGYLILFDTHALVPQRQSRLGRPPSRSEFRVISTHFTATPRVPPAPSELKPPRFDGSPPVEPVIFTADAEGRLRTL